MPSSNRDKQHNEAFGYHIDYFTDNFRREIQCIRDDVPFINFDVDSDEDEPKVFCLSGANARAFTNLAWELLGRYIANNTILKYLGLECVGLTDEKMSVLFGTLTNSDSIKELDLDYNTFGIEGMRIMMPFLYSCSSKLTKLLLGYNNGIDTECFDLVVRALRDGAIEELNFTRCDIEDISVLVTHALPNLTQLNLDYNNIGREGCTIISNLLQKEGSTLTHLGLEWTGIDDEGAEILVDSLKHNKKLKRIFLKGNEMRDRGYRAFLKLLIDISSIQNTFNSNRTLEQCLLTLSDDNNIIQTWIDRICCGQTDVDGDVGDAKIITYQLNSQYRKELCHLQGVEYRSTGNLLANIEPVLLPKILVWIGRSHGQSEMYTALQSLAPDLMSFVDTKALLKDKIASLTEELANLNSRLAFKELGDCAGEGNKGEGGNSEKNKRQRSASS